MANDQERINKYDDVFHTCELAGTSIVKMKIIQEMIQVERPKNWNFEKLETVVRELIKMEKYNANVSRSSLRFERKWNLFERAINF
jgi:hypothetical protein